jgi:hypothetical protein
MGLAADVIGRRLWQTFVGSKTEQALLNFGKALKTDYMQIRQVRRPLCSLLGICTCGEACCGWPAHTALGD